MALTKYVATFTTGGPFNTKTAYTQIVASTPYASSRLHLVAGSSNVSDPIVMFDIAVGGAGAEVVVAANIMIGGNLFIYGEDAIINVDIPAGSRIAIRGQATGSTVAFTVGIFLEDRALGSLANPVNYGANTATSRGISIDPGGVASTKGAYVQMTASTSVRTDMLFLCMVGLTSGMGSFLLWNLDIAIGASGSEVIIIPDLVLTDNPNGSPPLPEPGWVVLPVSIPAGSRIAARCSSSDTGAGTRVLSLVLVGMQDIPFAGSGGGGATSVAYVG